MYRLDLQGQPLDLDLTLACGQAFRWRKLADGKWSGVVRDRLIELRMQDGVLLWRTYPEVVSGRGRPDTSGCRDVSGHPCPETLVRDYLRLGDDVNAIYAELAAADAHMAGLVERFRGLRLVRQDPAETLLSFICSAANSIPRISAAIESLAAAFGELVCEKGSKCYHAFPRVETLASADESVLRATESLAFRGANLRMVAEQVLERGEGWLASLRGMSFAEAREALLGIRGVGAKIADCVCLFSLDKDESVPVDTHVRQLAHRLFLPEMKAKGITDSVYRRIRAEFAARYGRCAGWAQQFLFYEDLLRTRAMGRGL